MSVAVAPSTNKGTPNVEVGTAKRDTLGLEGMDLSAYLHSSEPLERGRPVFQRWHLGRSVRTERWKLVSQTIASESNWRQMLERLRSQPSITLQQLRAPAQAEAPGADWQLYDMTRDVTETTDIAKLHPQVVAELSSAYDRWLERVKPH